MDDGLTLEQARERLRRAAEEVEPTREITDLALAAVGLGRRASTLGALGAAFTLGLLAAASPRACLHLLAGGWDLVVGRRR